MINTPFLYHLVVPLFTPGVKLAALPTELIWSVTPFPLINSEGVRIKCELAAQLGAYMTCPKIALHSNNYKKCTSYD